MALSSLINLNDTSPAAPNGMRNVKWQGDAAAVRNVSAYVPNYGGVNAQTGTTYTIIATDQGKLLTFSNVSPVAVTITAPATLGSSFACVIQNNGARSVTLTPAAGTINLAAALPLLPGQGCLLFSDGANLQAIISSSPNPSGLLTYFLQHTAASPVVAGYLELKSTTDATRTTQTITAPADGSVLQNFISDGGSPGITFLADGEVHVHLHASVAATAGKHTYKIYGALVESDSTGADVGVICYTEESVPLTTTETEIELYGVLTSAYFLAALTSRLTLRLFVSVTGSGSTTDVNLYYGGTSGVPPQSIDVRIEIPVPGGGAGGVTSVAMTGDGTVFNPTVAGSPISGAGTLAPALLTQLANTVLAGPTSGAAAAPTFRTLSASDLPPYPTLTYAATIGDGSNTTYNLTHGLGTTDVLVQVHAVSGGEIEVVETLIVDVNTVQVVFASAPAASSQRVVVLGAAVASPLWNSLAVSPDRPPASPSAFDDEFDAAAINGTKWSVIGSTLFSRYAQQNSRLLARGAKFSTENLNGIVQAAPAFGTVGVWDMTAEIEYLLFPQNYSRCGICMLDPTGKLIAWGISANAQGMRRAYFNSVSSWNAEVNGSLPYTFGNKFYVRIRDDGRVYMFLMSIDGLVWLQYRSDGRTVFPGSSWNPTGMKIGLFLEQNQNSWLAMMSSDWFRVRTQGTVTLATQQAADGAVHQYKLNDTSGTAAVDTGSTPVNGSYVNAPTLNATPAVSPDNAGCVLLNGTNQYVNLNFKDPPADGSTGAWTIEAVFDNIGNTAVAILAANDNPWSSGTGLMIAVNSTAQNTSYPTAAVGFTGGMAVLGLGQIEANGVYHLALVYAGTTANTLTLYVNGVQQQTVATSGTYRAAAQNMCVGFKLANSGAADYCNGYFANVAFYNKALTSGQIAAHCAGFLFSY